MPVSRAFQTVSLVKKERKEGNMRTEKLFTVIGMLMVFGVAESFGAASIRSVGGGESIGNSARAGSLRSGSLKASSAPVSSNISVSSSDATAAGTRMASLPGGMPKVSKPNLPSGAYYNATVDLSDIEARLDDLQLRKAEVDALDSISVALSTKASADDLQEVSNALDAKANAQEVSDALATKANADSVYDKDTVDGKLTGLGIIDEDGIKSIVDGKLTPYSTTAQMNTALSSKANTNDVYTKSQVDTALDGKVSTGSVYSKGEVDNALSRKADASSLDNYVSKPTGGSAGQVLALNSSGGFEWVNQQSGSNIQIKTFDNIVYYCGKPAGNTCNESNVSDGWVAINVPVSDGNDGKTAWLKIEGDIIYVCYKETQCGTGDTWTQLVSLGSYAKSSDLTSLSNQINNETTGLAAAYNLANQANEAAGNAYTPDSLTTDVIQGLGFATSDTISGTYATQSSLNNYIPKPTDAGNSGDVLALNSTGDGFEWVTPSGTNPQLTTFEGVLYYCGKPAGATCDPLVQTDGWASTGFTGGGGGGGCQNFIFQLNENTSTSSELHYDIYCDD